jgi:hypothetical protein
LTHNRSPNIRRPFFSPLGYLKKNSRKFRISNKTFREADVKVKIIDINYLLREKEHRYIMPY